LILISRHSNSELEYDSAKPRIHKQFIRSKHSGFSKSTSFEGSTLPRNDFDKLLLEAVDEGLSTLGESSKHAIYFHLAISFHVKKNDIPKKIEEFAAAIEKIFGLGANFLEIIIMRRLYEKVDGRFKWNESKDLTFTEYVAAAKRSFLEKKAKAKTEELIDWPRILAEG